MDRAVYRGLLLFAATALALYAFGLILLPFVVPIAWALCLAAVTARPYQFLARRLGRPRLASLAMVLGTALVVLAPLFVLGVLVVQEAGKIDFTDTQAELRANVPDVVAWLDRVLAEVGLGSLEVTLGKIQKTLPDVAQAVFGGPVTQGAIAVLLAPFFFLFGFVIALITLYFVYCEAPRLRNLVRELSPLEEADTDRILDTLRETTAAAILGGVLVAMIQGALGGIAFVVAGIGSPVLWSVVMMGFSLLPFGGTALVWAPAGIYLLLTGQTFGGTFVLIWGVVVVGMSDNFLRPWVLTRTGAKDLHPMLLFFAILSGIGLFGISGIVFGPLLLAFLITMVQIYRAHGGSHDPAEEEPPGEAAAVSDRR